MADGGRIAASAISDLESAHDRLWDGEVALAGIAPGAAPGVDLTRLNLHSVRESALGAFLDLETGKTERAVAALEAVLQHQYLEPRAPWDGTFKVSAEDPPPGPAAQEWLHYDPNWRQFLGCILACIDEIHHDRLTPELTARLRAAGIHATRSEPRARIPEWYTNPYLMQTWLAGRVGLLSSDDDLATEAHERMTVVEERFRRYGDVDEYNSPTYDGIDLFALALWVRFPPNERFTVLGEEMLSALGNRISTLYHPGLHAMCGPHARAYGLDLSRYVSLIGQWLVLSGGDRRALPERLTEHTAHAHDLYFLPVFARLAEVIRPHLTLRPVESPRTHVQTFRDITARSSLSPGWALGAESGRHFQFARDQYLPVTVHMESPDGRTRSLGITSGGSVRMNGEVCDERSLRFHVEGVQTAEPTRSAGVTVVSSDPPNSAGAELVMGRVQIVFSDPPAATQTSAAADGSFRTGLVWSGHEVRGKVTLE